MTVTVGEAKEDLIALKELIKKTVESYQKKNTHLLVSGSFYNSFRETSEGPINSVEVTITAHISDSPL